MQPPRFWHRPPSLLSTVLSPLGALYAAGTARRLRRGTPKKLPVPVICIGNINAGGTGKTPTVIALVERLKARGLTPHVISRGYGGTLDGPICVDERAHSALETGDEPLLIAAFTPTWVAKDRLAGAEAAVKAGADIIILDDGFQNPAIHYDVALVVVDAVRGFGNGKVMPAGPLREPVETGLIRASAVLSIGPSAAQTEFQQTWGAKINKPHVQGRLLPLQTGMDWAGLNCLAFAGIGHPDKFFATLRDLGANVVKSEPLEDHQPLTNTLMTRLNAEARALNLQLVTTEKDAVRLPTDFRKEVLTLPVRLEIEDWSALDHLIENALTSQRR